MAEVQVARRSGNSSITCARSEAVMLVQRDFVDCTAAAKTQAHTRIESANFYTRGFDHVYLRSNRGDHKHVG